MRWTPAVILGIGAIFTVGPDRQTDAALREPLATVVPLTLGGYTGIDVVLSDAERRKAGVSAYVAREYRRVDTLATAAGPGIFAIYVGYYESQTRGKSIHSPRNCLPGSGWEPLTVQRETLRGPYGDQPVNRYLLQNGDQLALVLYWYQGRGRAAANEYLVKWELLRDAALRGRSEEALMRVVVPVVQGDEEAAWQLGRVIAERLTHVVEGALPAWD